MIIIIDYMTMQLNKGKKLVGISIDKVNEL